MPDGCIMESSMFTDLQVRYIPKFAADALTLVVGFNNLLDETPVNIPCEIGPSRVLHDLPGTVGYVRVTYQKD